MAHTPRIKGLVATLSLACSVDVYVCVGVGAWVCVCKHACWWVSYRSIAIVQQVSRPLSPMSLVGRSSRPGAASRPGSRVAWLYSSASAASRSFFTRTYTHTVITCSLRCSFLSRSLRLSIAQGRESSLATISCSCL